MDVNSAQVGHGCPDGEGARPAVSGGRNLNLSARCGGAIHPKSAIIFNKARAAVPAGRRKCVTIVPHATLVAPVAALPTTKKSIQNRNHGALNNKKSEKLK